MTRKRRLATIGVLSLSCVGALRADELSSANYRVTSHVVVGGAAGVDTTNATADSASYRTLLQVAQVATSDDREHSSANYRVSNGHLHTIWGLGTSTDQWMGTTDAGVETTDVWANAFNWGYGIPASTTSANIGPARAGGRLTGTGSVSVLTVSSLGSLALTGGGILQVDSSLTVSSGGTLRTTGTTAASRARIRQTAAGTYTFSLAGTMDVSYLTVANLAGTGLVVQSTATLTGWTGVTFTGGAAGGVYLDLALAGATSLPASIDFCQFDSGPANNVRSGGSGTTHANVTFNNWAGLLGGEANETNDALDLVDWGAGAAVVRLDGTGQPTYATLTEAVLAVGANNERIEVRDNAIRDESLDLGALTPFTGLTIDGAILRVTAASPGPAILGTSAGAARGETVKNLVLIRASGTQPLLWNVQNTYHCTIVGDYDDVGGTTPLVVQTAGTCNLRNCIVGDPNDANWNLGGGRVDPIAGAFTFLDYCLIQEDGTAGTGNVIPPVNPDFVMVHPSSGVWDVHLRSTSVCIDRAPALAGMATDMDRGTDFANDANNARRPSDDPSRANNPAAYDIGADEFGPLVEATSGQPQGVPVWVERAGNVDTAAANPVGDPDSFTSPSPSYNWSPFVLFMGENRTIGSDLLVVARRMDNGNILASYDVNEVATGIDRIVSITSKMSVGGATEDVYLVVDTNNDTLGDALIALQYNGAAFVPHAGWDGGAVTPHAIGPAGAFPMGLIAIGRVDATDLFVVRGGNLYRRNRTNGVAPNAGPGDWNDDIAPVGDHGPLDGRFASSPSNHAGSYDAEGALYADLSASNLLWVAVNRDGLGDAGGTHEIVIIEAANGVERNPVNLNGPTDVGKNHTGFALMNGRIWATPWQDNYVFGLKYDDLTFAVQPTAGPYWRSVDLGRNVTTRPQTFRTSDGHVRVGAMDRVFKLRKADGTLAADSGAASDWGADRAIRGQLASTPAALGSAAKTIFDTGVPGGASRRGAKLIFGTDQGNCYILSYIRATSTSDDTNGDYQRANNGGAVNYDILDGRPYPGYPYRIPGVKILRTFVATHSSGRNLIVFLLDNGWMYAFIEPY